MSVSVLICALVCALSVSACGQSAEQKAQKAICGARSEIEKNIKDLQSLTISTASVDKLKQSYSSIKSELQVIRDNAGKLNSSRKQKVTEAASDFGQEIQTIASGLTSNLSLTNASTQIRDAVTKLESSAQSALAPIECS